jgi:phage terminase large subunit-like protein
MRDGPKARLSGEPLDLPWLGSDRGERLIRFTHRFARLTKGPRAGELVKLKPFQKAILRGAFSPGVRQAYVSMGGKGGKSFLAACAALFGLCADTEQGDGREVYLVAGDERQARIVFNMVRRMVELDDRHSRGGRDV